MRRWYTPLILFILSVGVLLVSFLPAPFINNQMVVDTAVMYPEQSSQNPQLVHFQMVYPYWVRLNEDSSFLLRINLDGTDGGNIRGWQARLEMSDVAISPQGESRQRVVAGTENVFRWKIKPYTPTAGRGTLWVYRVRANGIGKGDTQLILAHPFEIRIWNWMGGSGWMLLRVMAGGGLFISLFWAWNARRRGIAMRERGTNQT